jgi:hypothetical protein
MATTSNAAMRTKTPFYVSITSLGGRRILDELEDDPLPRIC